MEFLQHFMAWRERRRTQRREERLLAEIEYRQTEAILNAALNSGGRPVMGTCHPDGTMEIQVIDDGKEQN